MLIFPIVQLSRSSSFWPSVCCFRSAWYGASSWMSRAVPCRNGSDSSAPPGTAKSKTWRRCRIYLADRWFFIFFYHVTLPGQSFLFCFCFIFWHLDTSANLSLSTPLSFLDFLPRAERNPCRRGAQCLVLQRSSPVVRHPHHGHPHARRER